MPSIAAFYITTDLIVWLPPGVDDAPLVAALDKPLLYQSAGRAVADDGRVYLPFACSEQAGLAADLEALLTAIESLPHEARAVWDAAGSRTLSIGLQGGTTPHAVTETLASPVVSRIAACGAAVELVLYAAHAADAADDAERR